MHIPQNLTSISSVAQALNLADLDRQSTRERSLHALQMIVINEIQQGDPAMCSAFADFCASRMDSDTTTALCLARINRDNHLLSMALKWMREHVDKCQALFVAEEVERRIAAALVQELPQ